MRLQEAGYAIGLLRSQVEGRDRGDHMDICTLVSRRRGARILT